MLESIALRNFQSHKKTIINLSPKVNAIIGSSNSGKTSILRGLYWAINNRPNGSAFISYWNRDKKGEPIKSTSIAIKNNSATIRRIKSPEMNGYTISNNESENKITLEAIKFDVPEQVEKVLNIGEVNFQQQMDAPFLLSESASEVARFLNREIRLDAIDRMLGTAESKRRKYNQEIKQIEADISQVEKDIEKYKMLDRAVKLNNKLKAIEASEETIVDQLDFFAQKVNDYAHYNSIIEKYTNVSFKNIEAIIKQLDFIKNEEKKLLEDIEDLDEMIQKYEMAVNDIKTHSDIVGKLIKTMPTICPACGKKMDGRE